MDYALKKESLFKYRLLSDFENMLGSIDEPENIFSHPHCLTLDEHEQYPEEAVSKLNNWGMNNYYIPIEQGGKLDSFETLFWLLRLIARRDLTIAIVHGITFLGASGVWVGGNQFLQSRLSSIIKEGEAISLGLTEREHGGDLVSNETSAYKVNEHYKLSGEKWLINNANKGRALTVFAKTNHKDTDNPRSHSLIFVDKMNLSDREYTELNKIKTYGVRGADISGIAFDNAKIPQSNLVGEEGKGLEIIMKSLQISRTLCASLSLGVGDTALHLVHQYVKGRKLYNNPLIDLPFVKEQLTNAYLDYLLCESIAIVTSRTIHILPEQMSLYSAIAKYFVPVTVENIHEQLAKLLGSRLLLADEEKTGFFQKIKRDNELVGLFDGSKIVNLQLIAEQLQSISRKQGEMNIAVDQIEKIDQIFDVTIPLPKVNFKALCLSNHGKDFISVLLDCSDEIIIDVSSELTKHGKETIKNITEHVRKKQIDLFKRIILLKKTGGKIDCEIEKIIEEYCLIFSFSCYLFFWLSSCNKMQKSIKNETVLIAVLSRIAYKLTGDNSWLSSIDFNTLFENISQLRKKESIISHFVIDREIIPAIGECNG